MAPPARIASLVAVAARSSRRATKAAGEEPCPLIREATTDARWSEVNLKRSRVISRVTGATVIFSSWSRNWPISPISAQIGTFTPCLSGFTDRGFSGHPLSRAGQPVVRNSGLGSDQASYPRDRERAGQEKGLDKRFLAKIRY